ncbi:MAG: carboxypeptidase-like regulatory domain-containing protein [Bacteroidetes bacterium]|nr:carboxypeptidase-like regulatory domain-containing protein [Bacteroidota bacterium]
MFRLIQYHLQESAAIISTYLPLQSAYNDFFALFTAMEVEMMNQKNPNPGIRLMKMKTRQDLTTWLVDACDLAHPWALLNQDPTLAMLTDVSKTKFNALREREFSGVIYELHDALLARMPGLESCGITPAALENFLAKADDYSAQMVRTKEAINQGKDATEKLKQQFVDGRKLLKSRMDKAVTFFRTSHRDFYDMYWQLRKIKDAGSETPKIAGMVKNKDGQPVKGLVVRISGSKTRKSITTAGGRFKFVRIKDGKYTLNFFENKKRVASAVVETGVFINFVLE